MQIFERLLCFFNFAHDQNHRPSVVFKPLVKFHERENKWMAVYGDSWVNSPVGIGDSPQKALDDFDVRFLRNGHAKQVL